MLAYDNIRTFIIRDSIVLQKTVQHNLLDTLSLEWGNSNADKGEVFTKSSIVDFMLDVSSVSETIVDNNTKILEPSCGQGEFVLAIAKNIIQGYIEKNIFIKANLLVGQIYAFDISINNITLAKNAVIKELVQVYSYEDSFSIACSWFYCQDFLLWDSDVQFTLVIGNPPYVRIENIPKPLLIEYRNRFSTMTDRADIYIAFFEKALKMLAEKGKLIYICTDRWMKNQYGRKLRNLVSSDYNLSMVIDLYGQNAFQSNVLTYPAITLLDREKNKKKQTLVIHDVVNKEIVPEIKQYIQQKIAGNIGVIRNDIVKADSPWLLGGNDEVELVKYLEDNFPSIEDAGCQVYIGAATGNNNVYIIDDPDLIEWSRRIPVVTATDIRTGTHIDSGKYIINTYDESGVVELANYPLLEEYLREYFDVLSNRHTAKKNPKRWYKTIDRVHKERALREKLLIPDIKSNLTIVHDQAGYHPNNSIYYICSDSWHLGALKFVLDSGVGQLFVENYSTKVSGGNLRFQAQHLRRIRLPLWDDLEQELQIRLIQANADNGENINRTSLISRVYNLSEKQLQILGLS